MIVNESSLIPQHFFGQTVVTADLEHVGVLKATLLGKTDVIALLQKPVEVEALVEGSTALWAFLQLNNEPNEFPEALISGSTAVSCDFTLEILPYALMQGSTIVIAGLTVSEAEDGSLEFIIDVLPELNPVENFVNWRPRFIVDGTELPVISWSFDESENSAGGALNVQLARLRDRLEFTSTSIVSFGIGEKSAGVWDEASMEWFLQDCRLDGMNFTVGYSDGQVTDTVSIRSSSTLQERLTKSSLRGLIFYDAGTVSITSEETEPVRAIDGTAYYPVLIGQVDLSLYDVLTRVLVTECGFDSYVTNIPNYPVKRVDCPIGSSMFDSVKGLLGQFEPVIFTIDNVVWILDTTLIAPAGLPLPQELRANRYQILSFTSNRRRLDALLVNLVENKRDYDYTTQENSLTTTYFLDQEGYEVSQQIDRQYIEFRRLSNPNIVLRRELQNETITTFHPTRGTIFESVERYTYDSNNRPTLRTKVTKHLLPLPYFPNDLTLITTGDERETYEYAVHPWKPRLYYQKSRTLRVTGALARDTENRQLEQNFDQMYLRAYQQGNLKNGFTLITNYLLSYEKETVEPLRDEQARYTEFEYDGASKTVKRNLVEIRPGDVALNDMAGVSRSVLVFDTEEGVRSTDQIESVHYGELPFSIAIPLAMRTIKKLKTKQQTISVTRIGYSSSYRRGYSFRMFHREEAIGNFIALGRTVRGDQSGVFTELECKQI